MGYFVSSSSTSSTATSSSPSTSSESLVAADLEAGFSGCAVPSAALYPPPRPLAMALGTIAPDYLNRRGGSSLGARPPAVRPFFCDGFDDDEPRHFLDSCFRCKKPLSGNCDIFMYRGDTPFCSDECRQEQIEIDEERESKRKLRLKASSRKDGKAKSSAAAASSSPPKSSSRYQVRATGTVVAG